MADSTPQLVESPRKPPISTDGVQESVRQTLSRVVQCNGR